MQEERSEGFVKMQHLSYVDELMMKLVYYYYYRRRRHHHKGYHLN